MKSLKDRLKEMIREVLHEELGDLLNTPKPKKLKITTEDEEDSEDGRSCRDMTCIAPKCGERSKGPRFHYLCEDHADTPLRKVRNWQEKAREERMTE